MKRRVLKLYVFRHGQSTFNRDHRFTGSVDAKLTRKGILHAKLIARKLKSKKFQVAIHTHLSRSKDTLKEVLKFHPECTVILQDDRMIERSYGDLQGLTHEEFIRRIGKQEFSLLSHGDAIENLNPKMRKEAEKFLGEEEYNVIHRGYNTPPPKGESFADVEKRVKSFISDLIKFIKKKKVSVAISAHGNSIRLLRKILENASVKETVSWFIPYDKVFEYSIY